MTGRHSLQFETVRGFPVCPAHVPSGTAEQVRPSAKQQSSVGGSLKMELELDWGETQPARAQE